MEARGHDRCQLLDGTGINPERFTNAKDTVSPTEELQFYRNLVETSNTPHILLEAGFNLNLPSYGIWGLALLSSPTFGKAIELGIQFIDFSYTYNLIEFVEEERLAGVRVSESEHLGSLQTPMIERDLAAIFVLFKALLNETTPVQELRLSQSQIEPKEFYENLFSCRVLFDQDFDEILFLKEKLNRELPQQNELALDLCKEQLEQIRPLLVVDDSASFKVQEYLSSTPLYRTDMEKCSQKMNITSRTLRRKLETEGTSYQRILDEFRNTLAVKYLNSTSMTLEEIAERLGFSDAANFSHAFKRWCGHAPRASKENRL